MTKLLVSVRNVAEARVALAAGADLIDVKEPDRGSLGAASAATIREVCELLDGRVPCSAALGELLDDSFDASLLPTRLAYAKVGLAGCRDRDDWRTTWNDALGAFPAGVQRVAVAYADWQTARAPSPEAVMDAAVDAGCAALLIDTWEKRGRGLFDFLSLADLKPLLARSREAGVLTVLAGSLTSGTIPAALSLSPDYLAVRGAACKNGRVTALSRSRIESLLSLLDNRSEFARRRSQPANLDC